MELGLVASLGRPGGNVTGTSYTPGPEIFGKQLQILKEAISHASRIAILRNVTDKTGEAQSRAVEAAARTMGIHLQHVEARGPEEFDSAFAAMVKTAKALGITIPQAQLLRAETIG